MLCNEVHFCVTGGWYAASLLQVLPMPVLLVARREKVKSVGVEHEQVKRTFFLFITGGTRVTLSTESFVVHVLVQDQSLHKLC